MRLLLTRAAADAARTAARLDAMGHTVLVSPVIEMVATQAPWPRGVVDGVVASSAQAFAVAGTEPSPETRRVIPLFLVGERTAASAREAGFLGAATIGETAADLCGRIGRMPRPGRLLYLAGRDRKPELEAGLSAMATDLVVSEVYRAQATGALDPVAREALEGGRVDGVLHYSRRSAALFCRIAPDSMRPLRHFALSEDTAVPLREAGCVAVRVAEAPTEAALLALVAW